jgi:hypothetical protein
LNHRITTYLEGGGTTPIRTTICTDDTLPFRTSLIAEYALLMAPNPLGLGMGEEGVRRVAGMGFGARFGVGAGE